MTATRNHIMRTILLSGAAASAISAMFLTSAAAQENSSGSAPAPSQLVAHAGVDRVVVLGGKTYLHGRVQNPTEGNGGDKVSVAWSKESGPGEVHFEDPTASITAATFSAIGDYSLALSASQGTLNSTDTLHVKV